MKKGVILKTVLIVLLVSALCTVVISRMRTNQFAPKRQNENQIIAYQDSNIVELYYHNDQSRAVEIRAELIIDGPYEVARAVAQPDETVTVARTTTGEPYSYFVPGVYAGDILVYDYESGALVDRKTSMECRIYGSCHDSYDVLVTPSYEREIIVDEEEHRPAYHKMRVDLKSEEIQAGLYGLCSEWRELDSYIYAELDGEEILVARAEHLPPRSITFYLYMEPGVAQKLNVGDVIPNVRVDSYYSDTGEFYDTIPAEIYEVVRWD